MFDKNTKQYKIAKMIVEDVLIFLGVLVGSFFVVFMLACFVVFGWPAPSDFFDIRAFSLIVTFFVGTFIIVSRHVKWNN